MYQIFLSPGPERISFPKSKSMTRSRLYQPSFLRSEKMWPNSAFSLLGVFQKIFLIHHFQTFRRNGFHCLILRIHLYWITKNKSICSRGVCVSNFRSPSFFVWSGGIIQTQADKYTRKYRSSTPHVDMINCCDYRFHWAFVSKTDSPLYTLLIYNYL